MRKSFAIAALLLALLSSTAAAAKADNSISAPAGLHYGDLFAPTASWANGVKEPWAYAVCYANGSSVVADGYGPGDEIWSGYRSLVGLTGYEFLLADPIRNVWQAGGADCRIDLVDFRGGSRLVLASSEFTVLP